MRQTRAYKYINHAGSNEKKVVSRISSPVDDSDRFETDPLDIDECGDLEKEDVKDVKDCKSAGRQYMSR